MFCNPPVTSGEHSPVRSSSGRCLWLMPLSVIPQYHLFFQAVVKKCGLSSVTMK